MNNENENNVQYVKSINGYPIKDETARTEIASIETDIDDKISASENELRVEIANTYATQQGLATTDAKIDTTADAILLEVSQTYETQTGTDSKISSAIQQSASEILSSVSETYATGSELTSAVSTINQRADGIESSVATKVGNDEIISKINQSAEQVSINANKIDLTGKTIDLTGDSVTIDSTNFQVDANGNITANNATLSNVLVNSGHVDLVSDNNWVSRVTIDNGITKLSEQADVITLGNVVPESDPSIEVGISLFGVYKDNISEGWKQPIIEVSGYNSAMTDHGTSQIGPTSISSKGITGFNYVDSNGPMSATAFNTISLLELKKNIEKSKLNALDIIKNADVHEFNYKTEQDTDKKHVGFIIGEGYNTPKEFISNSNDSIDNSSVIGILVKSIQELQKEIEELKAMINK